MFFGKNYLSYSATYTINTYIGLSDYLYDRTTKPLLSSSGYNNDSTSWTILINFVTTITFDTILLDGLNATGVLEAYVGGTWTTAYTIPTIQETVFSKLTNPITTQSVRLTLTNTGTNSEKTIGEFILASFLGQVVKNPSRIESLLSESNRTHTTSSGSVVYVKLGQAFKSKLMFDGLGATDMHLIKSLKNRVDPFYIYLCGGSPSSEFGFTLQDYYLVNYINNFEPKLRNQILGIGENITVEVHEA